MKTAYTHADVRSFLETKEHAVPTSVEQLSEGHISQAFGFETLQGDKLVLRISEEQDDFLADKYASEIFGADLLVPKIIEVGQFKKDAYYCISQRVSGINSNALSDKSISEALSSIHEIFAKIFNRDISTTSGYGHPNLITGNAPQATWKATLADRLDKIRGVSVEQNASNIGVDPTLIKKFEKQHDTYLPYASEVRRLTHGDIGFDNILIDGKKVTAVIDWAGLGYGDWMYDFAKLDFWWPGRFGDAKQFAKTYGLETDNLDERKALYWARSALSTIQWADEYKSEAIQKWLRDYVSEKLVD